MTQFTVVLEYEPIRDTESGILHRDPTQWTESVEAEDIEDAWSVARKIYYLAGRLPLVQIVKITEGEGSVLVEEAIDKG